MDSWFTTERITIATGIVGGALAWIWLQIRTFRKDKMEEDHTLLERESSYSAKLEARNSVLFLENAKLQQEIIELRMKAHATGVPPVEVLKTVIEACPKLMWAKRANPNGTFIVVQVSYSFAALLLGGSPKAYEDRDVSHLFPPAVKVAFDKQDALVVATKAPVAFSELVFGGPTGIRGTLTGYKFIVSIDDGSDEYIVAIADFVPSSEVTPSI